MALRCRKRENVERLFYTQGNQSTLMAPQVELPQSWINFSMEKTPVRSSTLRPYSACRPFSCASADGSRETHPIWATPMTLLFRFASRTPVQQGVGGYCPSNSRYGSA